MIRFDRRRFLSAPVRKSGALLAVIGSVWISGCMVPPVSDSARTGPFFKATNHTGDAQLPPNVRRVVLLPIASGTVAPAESVGALDAVFLTELQRKNRFEVVTLTRSDCLQRFQAEEYSSVSALPADMLKRLQREFAADAVMFVDLTVFKAYRPMALGIRSKLATLGENVHLIWTFDNVYSAADGAVANSARAHFMEGDRGGVPADLTPSVLQSPSRFASYVASDMFATLPPVYSPEPKINPKQGSEVAAPR
ncbi:MAG: hypothetical protein ABIV50_00625 [Opitutus sp.]